MIARPLAFVLTALLVSSAGVAEPVVIVPDSAMMSKLFANRTASTRVVPVQGQPFESALQVTVNEPGEYGYSVQLTASSVSPIRKGDVIFVTLYARTVQARNATGEGQLLVFLQKAGPPFSKAVYQLFGVPTTWTKIELPFKNTVLDTEAGGAALALGFGADAQTIEIAGATAVNYGPDYDLGTLPMTRLTYAGRELDAPWRAEAAARIERHRKGDLTVVVEDAAGNAVPDASVKVEMTRHAYRFGAAIYLFRWAEQSPTGERFREEILRNFNYVMPENSLKWQALEGDYGPGERERAVAFLQWAKDHGLHTQGHVLVWPGKAYTPKKYLDLLHPERAAELRAAINDHIRRIIAETRPNVDEWQVVNELWGNRDFTKILGDGEVAEWFRLAHREAPGVRLFINDYGIIDEYLNERSPHLRDYEKTIADLIAQGAPIGGIGSQSHFGTFCTPPQTIYTILERLARFDLPVQTTEFDVHIRDEDLQADYLRDYLTMFFSHPITTGFCHWGFWEGQHWKPHAALLRKDWSEKPNMKVWRDLVYNQWWTNAAGTTDAAGKLEVRGFLGEYRVTVEGAAPVAATLGREGATVVVRLP